MVICICNRINEREVHGAIAAGARCAEDVHACCGTEVNCGCCLDMIDEMLDAVRGVCAPRLQTVGA